MIQYAAWTRTDFEAIIRREVMDTNTRWFSQSELVQYLNQWQNELQQEYEFVWAINTLTTGTLTSSLIFPLTTFTPAMLRHEAVYYNGFRLAGRNLQDLEVGNPLWRSETTGSSTNTQDTPRLSVMYPDSQNILIWPTPPNPQGTSSNVFIFEYPALLTFTTSTDTCSIPSWCQYSAKSYVARRVYQRPGPRNDAKRAQRYEAQYQRARLRIRRMWDNYLPERFRRLTPESHYERNIILPPPAWAVGTNTATGT